MQKKKIYLAGFDVFYTNAIEVLDQKRQLCEAYGFAALTPLDNRVDFSQSKEEIRKVIYQANIKLMQEADILCVNLNAFRHGEPDSGTVFEIGYGVALNKDVYVYLDSEASMLEKTRMNDAQCTFKDGLWLDGKGLIIEDFDAKFNLMINESSQIINGSLEDVLRIIK